MNDPDVNDFFFSGLSGLELPVPKYKFPSPYENASRLTYYSSFFNSIEINSSFYKIPRGATVRNWATSVHEHFKFTFKLWKQITHGKGLYFEENDVESFFKATSEAGNKKGCLLVQLPPKCGIENFGQLDKLLNSIRHLDPVNEWNIAVEFRHKSWYHESIYNMLDSYHAALVIQDIPKSATPMIDLESSFIYVRFHGPTGNYRGGYSDEILSEHALYISDWLEEGKKVYVYFNNTMGDAFTNLQTLNKFVFLNK